MGSYFVSLSDLRQQIHSSFQGLKNKEQKSKMNKGPFPVIMSSSFRDTLNVGSGHSTGQRTRQSATFNYLIMKGWME